MVEGCGTPPNLADLGCPGWHSDRGVVSLRGPPESQCRKGTQRESVLRRWRGSSSISDFFPGSIWFHGWLVASSFDWVVNLSCNQETASTVARSQVGRLCQVFSG